MYISFLLRNWTVTNQHLAKAATTRPVDVRGRTYFNRVDRRLLEAINQDWGGTTETVNLDDPVKCEGNIEDWLCKLEASMQAAMRGIVQQGATECFTMGLAEFVNKYQS